jgi:pumilio RNA-binding family
VSSVLYMTEIAFHGIGKFQNLAKSIDLLTGMQPRGQTMSSPIIDNEGKLILPGMRSKVAGPPALDRLESFVTSPCVSDTTLTGRRLREMIPCTPSPMYAYDVKLGGNIYDPTGRFLPRFFPFPVSQVSPSGDQGNQSNHTSPNSSSLSAPGREDSPSVLTSPKEMETPITTPIAKVDDGRARELLAKIKHQAQPNGGFDLSKALHHIPVRIVLDDVVELSKDQVGSRFLQCLIEADLFSNKEREELAQRVIPEAKQLTVDPFANYVVQKVVENCSADQRSHMFRQLKGEIFNMSIHTYGCRVIQKLIEESQTFEQVAVARELRGHVIQCVEDQNGNHVIQKLIEKLPPNELSFVVNEFLGHIPVMAVHCYGCRVVQRLLEKLNHNDSSRLVTEILSHLWQLSQDQYGNYVVQHVLIHGTQQSRNIIMQVIASHIIEFSCHKYASNVAEKSLLCSDEQCSRDLIIAAVIGSGGSDSPLHTLMKDRFANYVIQRCIEYSHGPQREILVAILRANLPSLKRVIYGKHIANAIERIIQPTPTFV